MSQLDETSSSHAADETFSAFPAGMIVSLHTNDFDAMAAALPGWDQHYQQLGLGRFDGEVFMTHTARLGVGAASWSPGIMIRGTIPRRSALLAMPLGRCETPLHCGQPLRANSMGVLFDDEQLDLRATHPLRLFLVVVDRARLEDHAGALLGCPLDDVREFAQVAIAGASAKRRQLELTIRMLHAGVAKNSGQLQVGALAAVFEAAILDTILTGVCAPPEEVSASTRRRLAGDADAFLRSALSSATSIRDLCKAVNASERTLHLAFQEHIGMSPKAYLKVLRLNAVRHALRCPTELTTVTRTALNWGFWHLGWFASSYLKMFGETPIETLRNSRRELNSHRQNGALQFSDCPPAEG